MIKNNNKKMIIIKKVSCCSEIGGQTGQIKVSGQGGRHLMYYPRKSDFPLLWICILSYFYFREGSFKKKQFYKEKNYIWLFPFRIYTMDLSMNIIDLNSCNASLSRKVKDPFWDMYTISGTINKMPLWALPVRYGC